MEGKEYTLTEFQEVAADFAQKLTPGSGATVVALHGDLGAGKTTFVQNVARALGVQDDIISPTFIIQKRYELEGQKFARLVHVDAYRLESAHELEVLDWGDLVRDPANIVFIEWPENVEGLLDEAAHHVYFEYIDEDTRRIKYGKEN